MRLCAACRNISVSRTTGTAPDEMTSARTWDRLKEAGRCRQRPTGRHVPATALADLVVWPWARLRRAWALHLHLRPRRCPPDGQLRHQPETDDREVMIERVCKVDARALHDRKAGGIDGR